MPETTTVRPPAHRPRAWNRVLSFRPLYQPPAASRDEYIAQHTAIFWRLLCNTVAALIVGVSFGIATVLLLPGPFTVGEMAAAAAVALVVSVAAALALSWWSFPAIRPAWLRRTRGRAAK